MICSASSPTIIHVFVPRQIVNGSRDVLNFNQRESGQESRMVVPNFRPVEVQQREKKETLDPKGPATTLAAKTYQTWFCAAASSCISARRNHLEMANAFQRYFCTGSS